MGLLLGVHTLNSDDTAVSVTTAPITTQVSGSGLVLTIDFFTTQTFVSVSDSKGNAWVQIGTEVIAGATVAMRRYYCANAGGGSGHTFTATVTGIVPIGIAVTEILTTNGQGVLLDQQASAVDPTSPYDSPGITTTLASEFLLAPITSHGGGATYNNVPGNSFTLVDQETNGNRFFPMGVAYRLVSSISTYSATWTISPTPTNGLVCIQSFSEAPPILLAFDEGGTSFQIVQAP